MRAHQAVARAGLVLGVLMSGACTDPNAPPTGTTMPTDEELLAAVPGGGLVSVTHRAEDTGLPEFLVGTGFRFSFGVDKPRDGEPRNSDGGRRSYSWGEWHSFYAGDWARPFPLEPETPMIFIPSREHWNRPSARGHYRDGARVGTWTFWHPDGVKKAEGTFENDRMHGPWQFWTTNGAVDTEHTGTYENGEKV